MSGFFVGQIVWISFQENEKNVCHIKCKHKRSHGTRPKITGRRIYLFLEMFYESKKREITFAHKETKCIRSDDCSS